MLLFSRGARELIELADEDEEGIGRKECIVVDWWTALQWMGFDNRATVSS